jgi:hypothetical protein
VFVDTFSPSQPRLSQTTKPYLQHTICLSLRSDDMVDEETVVERIGVDEEIPEDIWNDLEEGRPSQWQITKEVNFGIEGVM